MGYRSRLRRAADKRLAEHLGYRENELGELSSTVTKADARRRFLAKHAQFQWENALIESMTEKIKQEIDEEIFDEIRRCVIEDPRYYEAVGAFKERFSALQRPTVWDHVMASP